jgi:hypothetical protein
MSSIVEELSRRWQAMFSDLQRGDDLAPGMRLRTEGMMEAAVLLEIATAEQLQSLMAQCYEDTVGSSLAEEFGADWCDFFVFPQIPATARRAPVYPSTRD